MENLATTALITAALTVLSIACTAGPSPPPADMPAVTQPTPAIQQTLASRPQYVEQR